MPPRNRESKAQDGRDLDGPRQDDAGHIGVGHSSPSTSTALTIDATATDTNGSGMASVELWQRFEARGSTSWSSWTKIATQAADPSA